MNRVTKFQAEVLEHAEEVTGIFLSFIPFSILSIFISFQIVQYFLFFVFIKLCSLFFKE